MANISAAKTFTAIVSVAALGAAISFSTGTALAQDKAQDKNVTEDQIVRALAPEKKPLTRGLSTGPQTLGDLTAAKGGWPLPTRMYRRPGRYCRSPPPAASASFDPLHLFQSEKKPVAGL